MNRTTWSLGAGTGLMRIQSFAGRNYISSGGFLRRFPFGSAATFSTDLQSLA
jgi:hypothetical protein